MFNKERKKESKNTETDLKVTPEEVSELQDGTKELSDDELDAVAGGTIPRFDNKNSLF